MTTKKEIPNPDMMLLPSGGLRLTITIDKINVDYEGVKIEGAEATYEARREAQRKESNYVYDLDRERARVCFTVPMKLAGGFGIGSIVTVTIEKPQSAQRDV